MVSALDTDSGDIRLLFHQGECPHQAEHPVTELLTGVDLAKGQILIAQGAHIDALIETPVRMRGHLFMPSPGRITGLQLPGGIGIRVDTAVCGDWIVPPHPIRCWPKLIAYDKDRPGKVSAMQETN